jgi:hypothetical protein
MSDYRLKGWVQHSPSWDASTSENAKIVNPKLKWWQMNPESSENAL